MAIQFDYSAEKVMGLNILHAQEYEDDLLFNESYLVLGNIETDKHIHATYDLFVIGDLYANRVTVNGSLIIFGNIITNFLQVQKDIFCSGKIDVQNINGFRNIFSHEINCNEIYCTGNLITMSTMNVDKALNSDGIVVVCEGIIGAGNFNAKNVIVNDYFEFQGKVLGNIFEISTMTTIQPVSQSEQREHIDIGNKDIPQLAFVYFNLKKEIQKQFDLMTQTEDEETIRAALLELTKENSLDYAELFGIFEEVVKYSYGNKIKDIFDYLILIRAKTLLPTSLSSYETVSGVFDVILKNAGHNVSELDFQVKSQKHFAEALKIAVDYRIDLGEQNYKHVMEKIFSSIGILYSTVRKTLNEV